MKLFRRERKRQSAEEEKAPVLDTDVEARPSAHDETAPEAKADAPTDTPAPQGNPLVHVIPEADAETKAEDKTEDKPPDAEVALLQEDDSLDSDLMDIFREAKNEAQESTLAAEVEDIPIRELLRELAEVCRLLGIPPPTGAEAAL